MPNQANVQDALINGGYKLATLVNSNLALINSGSLPVREGFISYFSLSLQGLAYRYGIGDYTSTTTITLYDRILGFIGIPIDAQVDSNFQAPNTTIIVNIPPDNVQMILKNETDLIADGFGGYYLPFLDADGEPFDAGIVPIELTVDGVGLALQPNYTFTPMRLYGFANNAAQIIILTVI